MEEGNYGSQYKSEDDGDSPDVWFGAMHRATLESDDEREEETRDDRPWAQIAADFSNLDEDGIFRQGD